MNLPQVIQQIEQALEAGPVSGPWRWWTSNSFRRLSSDATGKDGDVLYATVHPIDRHPDIVASEATMDFIASCNPHNIRILLDALETMREALEDIARGYDQGQTYSGSMCSEIARAAIDKAMQEQPK